MNTLIKNAIILTILYSSLAQAHEHTLKTIFEQSNGKQTATYPQVINYFEQLAQRYDSISIQMIGDTDAGLPLHLVTLNPQGQQSFAEIRKDKSILLINNGIHPGEPDGIDATMMLFRDIAQGRVKMPSNTVLATIPIYNIGGSLNRNAHSRTNQNGPAAYGFRGNARNFDLNRDFIKNDSRNAKAFAQIFHLLKPDVFIDNHVSNGADYQYTLTHLFTQHNKLGYELGTYLHQSLMPALEQKLKQKDWDITPYVNVFNQVPESGFSQFMDYPRYSTGYTSLFNTLGMMVETHMLKPYKQRVEGTYVLMQSMLEIVEKESQTIRLMRKNYHKSIYSKDNYTLDWHIDEEQSTTLDFLGYEATSIDSQVTNGKRLKYHRDQPFVKKVKYQNYFKPSVEIKIPKAYIIPKEWYNIIERLKLNQVAMQQLQTAQTIKVESYRISSYETQKNPFEGHYPHFNTQLSSSIEDHQFKPGDYLIAVEQPAIRYLLETLEPQGPDSFFNWNFFDSILQQKEHFSPYVFEDIAEQMLKDNPQLKAEFKQKQQSDQAFKENWYAQLDWLHKRSPHYEKSHMQYPIYRILK